MVLADLLKRLVVSAISTVIVVCLLIFAFNAWFQFSVENEYTVMVFTPKRDAARTSSIKASAPSQCPIIGGRFRSFAHLRFPSIIIATCFGTRTGSSIAISSSENKDSAQGEALFIRKTYPAKSFFLDPGPRIQ